MTYLILVSDCKWNRSFRSSGGGREEVRALLSSADSEFDGRLHTTLVALGGEENVDIDDLVNHVIPVSNDDVTNPSAVAERISSYVSACMHENRHPEAEDERKRRKPNRRNTNDEHRHPGS